MFRSKKFKKVLSFMLSAVVLGSALMTGAPAKAAVTNPVIKDQTFTGDATYINTNLKENYGGLYTGIEISFKYNNKKLGIDYNDTFQFLVFDTAWGGWNPTHVGPAGVDQDADLDIDVDEVYTVTVPINTIESKLSTGGAPYGINLQTGLIGTSSVTITEMNFVEGEVKSEPVVLEGSWKKTNDEEIDPGTMNLVSGFANVYANPWNIVVSGFSVKSFEKPTVAVTVEYSDVTDTIYPQSEILDSETYEPIEPHYPEVSEDGTVTYLTEIPQAMTSMLLAYDTCVVKKVEIYDGAEKTPVDVTDLTNENIVEAMGAGWNLGNALDSNTNGIVEETLWGNPVIDKRLFKQVAEAGFKTVRIPTTWLDVVSVSGDSYTIDESKFNERANRLQEVVDYAKDYGLFVIINVHHDGADGVTGSWLDVDASNQTGIRNAFEDLWGRIAAKFADYDKQLIFESMNEVMEQGNYGTPSATTCTNINALNQIFVDTVRTGGENTDRFLLIPGYNTNIDQTVKDCFVIPTDTATKKIIVSCHFYDPYDFTLNENSGKTTITEEDLAIVTTQFTKLENKFVNNGIPVIIGEFSAADKGNGDEIAKYITKVVTVAKAKGIGYVYWDNGYTGSYGMGLWNRYTYAQTALGEKLIPVLVK